MSEESFLLQSCLSLLFLCFMLVRWTYCVYIIYIVNQNFRFFIVYNEQTKEFKTARTCPKMVLVNVSLDGTDAVKLSAPDMPELRVKVPQASESNKHAHLK